MISVKNIVVPLDEEALRSYFKKLVNHFFKILPMREDGEEHVETYVKSLQIELLGFHKLVFSEDNDSDLLTLLSILQYLIDNPECKIHEVKREVFHAISLCNKLEAKFLSSEVSL